MPTPTFIASYTSDYTTSGASKNIAVTTQAGDSIVVYGGGDTNGITALTLNTPTGNGVTLTLLQSIAINSNASAFIWIGTDNTGGTGWNLNCTVSSALPIWGFTCLVFRNCAGAGGSNKANTTGAPSLSLTTQQSNSAVVVFNNDWSAVDGSSRVWLTVNGVTPTAGNNLERTYTLNVGTITVYGAYYNNAGAAGGITIGLSAPTGQAYSIVAAEILGGPNTPTAITAWFSG